LNNWRPAVFSCERKGDCNNDYVLRTCYRTAVWSQLVMS